MKLFKKLLLLLFVAMLILGSIITLQGYVMYQEVLKEIKLEDKVNSIQEEDSYVKLDTLPDDYIHAVVSVEDRRFYDHGAIDIRSIGRAVVTNIKKREIAEGGSTITQQLAKNLYFSQKQEFTRKIAEIFMAFTLEKQYTKGEILELYVNTSYFGDGYYGIGEASLGYFKKAPYKMNLDECTLIAGIPNAPSIYAPTKNPDLAKKRQEHVIETMLENNYLTKEEAKELTE